MMSKKKFLLISGAIVGTYVIARVVAKRQSEDVGIDADNLYLKNNFLNSHYKRDEYQTVYINEKDRNERSTYEPWKNSSVCSSTAGVYVSVVKPALDKVLSFGGLVVLSPLMAGIAVMIYWDDPGPVFFTQKRVGKDCSFFQLHKFRTMKMSTPHDVPTHKLSHPEKYITRIGRILRRTSLDEIPQIWDIFRGKMSIIGPRPALWNQEDLVSYRQRYCVNAVLPGLTGLAQIKGRDELFISDKAKLDGEYVKRLYRGGIQAFIFDVKLFFDTVASVFRHDGVVEGGTGSLSVPSDKFQNRSTTEKQPSDEFEDYGFRKTFNIDKRKRIKVLITGAKSYIGVESFKTYCESRYPNIECTVIDMVDGSWKNFDFHGYDTVFHVAGIAHADVGNVTPEQKKNYYVVNRDLAIETAKKSKESGIHQFIYMSSMIIYGEAEYIDEYTVPNPTNFYGDSKWQGDRGVRALASDEFKVAVLRSPMIYGRGSKGNYPKLAKVAKVTPIFPDYNNKRSMIYIENLCEFVCLLALSGEGGIYFPQNKSYSQISEIVRLIGKVNGKQVYTTTLLNPAVSLAMVIPGKVNRLASKAFGSSYYSQKISQYDGLSYCKVSIEESIKRTEGDSSCLIKAGDGVSEQIQNSLSNTNVKRILILVNHEVVIYNFRMELVERLLNDHYEVHISTPPGKRIEKLKDMGAIIHEIDFDRHGMKPLAEVAILRTYQELVKAVKPIIVFGYTIKPNIYGAIASRMVGVPFVANITGLGTAVENGGVKQRLIILMYKVAFGVRKGRIQRVFFQNKENEEFFRSAGIALDKHALLPGSGVNTVRFHAAPLPLCGDGKTGEPVKFAFISRIMKEKGIEYYLTAAKIIKAKYPATEFHVCGFCESEYDGRLEEEVKKGVVIYHGMIDDVNKMMAQMHCVIHPTYYPEGISNVLLEACATSRAIITTDRAGCKEVVENGVNGYMVPCKDCKALIIAIKNFLRLSWEQKKQMGQEARNKVEKKFDRNIVIEKYMEEIYRV